MKKIIYSVMMLAIAAFTLTSCEDVPAPYGFPEDNGGKEVIPIGDPEGTGVQNDPYNVAAALTLIKEMKDGEMTDDIYVKGKISAISEVSISNGNATYFISDDGSSSNELQVYRGKYLGGKSFTSEDQIKVGDVVIVKGKCKNFKGNTPEFDAGSQLYMINDVYAEVGTPEGTGTKEDPYNVAGALAKIEPMKDGELTDDIFVKGFISKVQEVSTANGNATYYITDKLNDDGSPTNELQVYRGLFLGGEKFTAEDQIKVGDEVIVKGKCKNFKGNTPEFDAGSYIYYLNGQTAEKQKPNTKFDPTGTGTENDPYNVAAVLQNFYDLEVSKSTEEFVVKGIVVGTPTINLGNGNADYYISDDGTEDDKLYVFHGLDEGNQKFTDGAKIKAGDAVVIKGKLTNYGGTLEMAQGNYLLSVNNGQGITKKVEGNTVTFTDNSLTPSASFADVIDLSQCGWENKQNSGLEYSTNMAAISFEQGDGAAPPAYYNETNGVRMFAKNILNVGGGNLKIAKVVLTCESETYVGNSMLYAESEGTTMTICNDYTSTRGGVQLRIQKIQIYYAQ